MARAFLYLLLAMVSAVVAVPLEAPQAADRALPSGFVYLADVAPEIQQSLRYATPENFTGKPVPGYATGECVLTRQTAQALARVQKSLAGKGYGLRVYDCYRPTRATAAFMAWAKGGRPGAGGSRYHPKVARSALVGAGYISTTSAHSTGTAVDLTLVTVGGGAGAGTATDKGAEPRCGLPPDGSVDMGTGFDCFDPLSHAAARGLSGQHRASRQTLTDAMQAHGFRGYAREWWHFSFAGEKRGPLRDFVVPPRGQPMQPKD